VRGEHRQADIEGQSPREVRRAKLLSDSSHMSNSAWPNARTKISSGSSSMNTGSTPSIGASPSTSGRMPS
jgi:hypothetical protein